MPTNSNFYVYNIKGKICNTFCAFKGLSFYLPSQPMFSQKVKKYWMTISLIYAILNNLEENLTSVIKQQTGEKFPREK